jgi:methyl-accepting chemotaxis protein PixJ
LSELTRAVKQIAIGNLDTSAVARGTLETRTLARSFNQMVARVKEFLREKEVVGTQAMQLLGDVQEIADSIQGVAANTQQAERRVRHVNQTVRASDDAMNQTVASIDTIQDTVTEMARKVRQLGETSQRISRAIVLIKQFSTQTNLLALNASVEASRAGKFGQGFAVVAKEIRALANQSADATQEIELLVNEIQTGTRNVAIAMEAGTQQVEAGTQWVETSREQLIQLAQTIAEIDTLVAEIARAASAQAQTSASVSASIRDVVDISRNERDKTS